MAYEYPIVVLPLDARPVCYQQVKQLAAMGNIQVILPPESLLGQLKQPADLEALYSWWCDTLAQHPQAALILSLDLIAYGGLISGRISSEPYDTLYQRVKRFLAQRQPSHGPCYGFSAILRIPNYNNSEEEPDYWQQYGKALYAYSAHSHQHQHPPSDHMIPNAILQDFLDRRHCHDQLNHAFLELVKTNQLDYLVFAQDDTGEYGLNVQEAQHLQHTIDTRQLNQQAHVQTGADEVALTLLARILSTQSSTPVSVATHYTPSSCHGVMALFDGQPLHHVVARQLKTIHAVPTEIPINTDFNLLIHGPSHTMRDHCRQHDAPQASPKNDTENTLPTEHPITIADVAYANGSDTVFTQQLETQSFNNVVGYAGWNTPGNSIGTALAMGTVYHWATQHNCLNPTAHNEMLLTRLLDDHAYQANVRQTLRQQYGATLPPLSALQEAMAPYITHYQTLLGLPPHPIHVSFPCQRTFEIALTIESPINA